MEFNGLAMQNIDWYATPSVNDPS